MDKTDISNVCIIQNKKLLSNKVELKRGNNDIIIQDDIIQWGQYIKFNCSLTIKHIWISTGNIWNENLILNIDGKFDKIEDLIILNDDSGAPLVFSTH